MIKTIIQTHLIDIVCTIFFNNIIKNFDITYIRRRDKLICKYLHLWNLNSIILNTPNINMADAHMLCDGCSIEQIQKKIEILLSVTNNINN